MSLVDLAHFLCYGSLSSDINKMLTLEWMENLLDILQYEQKCSIAVAYKTCINLKETD